MSSTPPPDPLRQLSAVLGEPTEALRPLQWFSTRDQRVQARILREAGFLYAEIAESLQLTIRQVGIAVRGRATPRRRSGRPPILTTNQVEELIEFIAASKHNRRLPFWRLAVELGWEGVSAGAIKSALARAGYKV
jgi:hypothetical protein